MRKFLVTLSNGEQFTVEAVIWEFALERAVFEASRKVSEAHIQRIELLEG